MAGFHALREQGQGDYTGKLETYTVNAAHATLLAPGDVMKITGTSDAEGRAEIDVGVAAAAITGIIASVEPQFIGENLTETGLPDLTDGKVHCHIDPNQLFIVDASATLLAADVGLNADALFTAATKTGGLTVSNMVLNSATKAITATLQFRIVALAEDANGVLGNRAIVRYNNTTLASGTAGV
jgi:hypothetical protein